MINEKSVLTRQESSRLNEKQDTSNDLRSWMLFAALFGIIVVILQGLWHPRVPIISNVFITDSLILYRGTLASFGIDLADFFDSSSRGLQLFYGPFKLIDQRLFFVPNLIMWLACIWAAYIIFNPIHRRAGQFAIVSLIFNPYLFLSLSGPTKELPLIFLVLFFLLLEPSWKRLPYFAVIIAVTYSIRDGYALLMLGWLILHLVLPKRLWIPGRIILCLVPLIILLGFRTFSSPIDIFGGFESEARLVGTRASSNVGGRNIERALESFDEPLLIVREYGFRLLANGFSDLVRPELFTVSNRISLVGVGFFVHAFFLAWGLVASIITILTPVDNDRLHYLSWFVILVWAVVGLVLFVQPRYLMPITPVAMGILGSRSTAIRMVIIMAMVVISVVGLFFLIFALDILPAISIDSPVKPPFFFFGSD